MNAWGVQNCQLTESNQQKEESHAKLEEADAQNNERVENDNLDRVILRVECEQL